MTRVLTPGVWTIPALPGCLSLAGSVHWDSYADAFTSTEWSPGADTWEYLFCRHETNYYALAVVDASDPTAPSVAFSDTYNWYVHIPGEETELDDEDYYFIDQGMFADTVNEKLYVCGYWYYVFSAGYTTRANIRIYEFDISDPDAPSLIATHDGATIEDTDTGVAKTIGSWYGLSIDGSFYFALREEDFNAGTYALVVLGDDAAETTRETFGDNFSLLAAGGTQPAAYVTTDFSSVDIWDLSNPSGLSLASTYTQAGISAWALNAADLWLIGTEDWTEYVLYKVDVSDIASPTQAAELSFGLTAVPFLVSIAAASSLAFVQQFSADGTQAVSYTATTLSMACFTEDVFPIADPHGHLVRRTSDTYGQIIEFYT